MCRVGVSDGQAELAAQPVDQQQRRDLADARLHRLQADQFAVELADHLVDVGRLELRLQVDLGVVGETAIAWA